MKVTQLRLKNFKIFKQAVINFKPFTLLTGTNSSGKSTVLNAITAVLQTNYPHVYPFEFVPNGKYCSLGSFKNVANQGKDNFSVGLTLQFDHRNKIFQVEKGEIIIDGSYRYALAGDQILPDRLSYKDNNDAFYLLWQGQSKGYKAKIQSKSLDRLFEGTAGVPFKEFITAVIKSGEVVDNDKKIREKKIDSNKILSEVFRPQAPDWFELTSKSPIDIQQELHKQPAGNYIINSITQMITQFSRSSAYIGPVRVYPLRYYLTEYGGDSVDPMGKNSITMLYDWKRHFPQKYDEVIKGMRMLELASSIDITTRLDEIVGLSVQPHKHREKVNFADVGFGVSQALPIIIADIAIPNKGLLLVNQPEVHLHPSSQAQLANYFASRLDKRSYVIETHSEYLINRLRLLVANNKLDSKDVSILFFDTVHNRATPQIHEIQLGSNGELINAPKSFFDTYYIDSFKLALGGEYNK